MTRIMVCWQEFFCIVHLLLDATVHIVAALQCPVSHLSSRQYTMFLLARMTVTEPI
jgi:cbb3-type cytochrome oxidase subunit 1